MDKLFLISEDDYYKHINEKVQLFGFLKQLAHFASMTEKKDGIEHLKEAATTYGERANEMFAGWNIPGRYLVYGDTDDLSSLMGQELWGEYSIDEIGRLVEHLDGEKFVMRAVAPDDPLDGSGIECSGCYNRDVCRGSGDEANRSSEKGDEITTAIEILSTYVDALENIKIAIACMEASSGTNILKLGTQDESHENSHKAKENRNKAIFMMREKGMTMQKIADYFGLTRGRVAQILYGS